MNDAIRSVRGRAVFEALHTEDLTLDGFTVFSDADTAGTWDDMLRIRSCPGLSLRNTVFPKA